MKHIRKTGMHPNDYWGKGIRSGPFQTIGFLHPLTGSKGISGGSGPGEKGKGVTPPDTSKAPKIELPKRNDIDLQSFLERVANEHHDAMKVVTGITLKIEEDIKPAYRKTRLKLKDINDILNEENDLYNYAAQSQAFVHFVDKVVKQTLSDQFLEPKNQFDYLLSSPTFKQTINSLNRFRETVESGLHKTRLYIIDNKNDREAAKIASALVRINDYVYILFSSINMVDKFHLGYKGQPCELNINKSIRDGLIFIGDNISGNILKTESIEDFDKRTSDENLPSVFIDNDLLFKVWLNTAANSQEASTSAKMENVPFSIKAKYFEDGNFIQIKIKDEGPGIKIDGDKIKTPNDIFKRGVSTKKGKNNKGFGMNIIEEIIKEAGGTISCETVYKKDGEKLYAKGDTISKVSDDTPTGTTITINLPALKEISISETVEIKPGL